MLAVSSLSSCCKSNAFLDRRCCFSCIFGGIFGSAAALALSIIDDDLALDNLWLQSVLQLVCCPAIMFALEHFGDALFDLRISFLFAGDTLALAL